MLVEVSVSSTLNGISHIQTHNQFRASISYSFSAQGISYSCARVYSQITVWQMRRNLKYFSIYSHWIPTCVSQSILERKPCQVWLLSERPISPPSAFQLSQVWNAFLINTLNSSLVPEIPPLNSRFGRKKKKKLGMLASLQVSWSYLV